MDKEIQRIREDCDYHEKQFKIKSNFLKAYDEKDEAAMAYVALHQEGDCLFVYAAEHFNKFKALYKTIPMCSGYYSDGPLPVVLFEFYERRRKLFNERLDELNQAYPYPKWEETVLKMKSVWRELGTASMEDRFKEMEDEREKEKARVLALTDEERRKEEIKDHDAHVERIKKNEMTRFIENKRDENYAFAKKEIWENMKEEETRIMNELHEKGWYPKCLGIEFHTNNYGLLESYILDENTHVLEASVKIKVNGGEAMTKHVLKRGIQYKIHSEDDKEILFSLEMIADDEVAFLCNGSEVHSWYNFDRYNPDYKKRIY
jgi:hypothetical protein